jgi:tetratricopeptide (TPR) repeat protein
MHNAAASVVLAAMILTAAPAVASAQSAEAYYEFLLARRLEAQGDQAGALAALGRAAAADPRAAEVRAEIASFQLRRNQRAEAEAAAREALVLDGDSLEAHRVLGVLYAAMANAQRGGTILSLNHKINTVIHSTNNKIGLKILVNEMPVLFMAVNSLYSPKFPKAISEPNSIARGIHTGKRFKLK